MLHLLLRTTLFLKTKHESRLKFFSIFIFKTYQYLSNQPSQHHRNSLLTRLLSWLLLRLGSSSRYLSKIRLQGLFQRRPIKLYQGRRLRRISLYVLRIAKIAWFWQDSIRNSLWNVCNSNNSPFRNYPSKIANHGSTRTPWVFWASDNFTIQKTEIVRRMVRRPCTTFGKKTNR